MYTFLSVHLHALDMFHKLLKWIHTFSIDLGIQSTVITCWLAAVFQLGSLVNGSRPAIRFALGSKIPPFSQTVTILIV
jgi:hypothetical protein